MVKITVEISEGDKKLLDRVIEDEEFYKFNSYGDILENWIEAVKKVEEEQKKEE